MNNELRILTILALMLLAAPQAFAEEAEGGADATVEETDATDKDIDEKEEDTKAWSLSAGLATTVGTGTFASVDDSATADEFDLEDPSNFRDRWNLSWSLGGSYTFLDEFSASVGIAAVQWLTSGGGLNDSGEYRWQDITAGLGWSGYSFGETGLSISGSASFAFPLSNASRTTNLVLGTGLGSTLAWRGFDGDLSLSYSLSGGKDFHSSKVPTVACDQFGEDGILFREGEQINNHCATLEGYNTEYSLTNSFGVGIGIVDNLRFSAGYSLLTYWSYAQDGGNDDEFTSENADPGRGVGQVNYGSLGLSYSLPDVAKALQLASFGTSLSLRTARTPKTADNSSFNFPFWNFDSAAEGSSSIRFGLSASY